VRRTVKKKTGWFESGIRVQGDIESLRPMIRGGKDFARGKKSSA